MQRLADQHDIPVIDLVSAFRAGGREQLFVDVIHANADGHQLVAELLAPVISASLAASFTELRIQEAWDGRLCRLALMDSRRR